MKTCNNSLNQLFNGFSGSILVEKPCKIVKINSQYSVDVEIYDNNVPDLLCNVPVKHLQTQTAYVFLGLKVGDRGTVRFFDTDSLDYLRGLSRKSSETRRHNINDNLFTVGFYPQKEQYVMASGDLVIGTSQGATLCLTGDKITVSGAEVVISAGSVTLGENTVIDGKNFMEHTHTNGNEGNPTGGVI